MPMPGAEKTLVCFLVSYALTGVALGVAMFLGHKGRIRGHISAILVFLAGFAVTIFLADRTGTFFHFDPRAQSIHMPLAYGATGVTLLPLLTGFRRWRGSGSLGAHKI